jgi:hypothetical protein
MSNEVYSSVYSGSSITGGGGEGRNSPRPHPRMPTYGRTSRASFDRAPDLPTIGRRLRAGDGLWAEGREREGADCVKWVKKKV